MENVQREVEEILEQYVRPGLRQHGGGIRLLEVKMCIRDRRRYDRILCIPQAVE